MSTTTAGLWWLSYAVESGSLGVVILRGSDFLDACERSARAGWSPGGQVAGALVPGGIEIADEWRNRHLTAGEGAELAASIDERHP